MHFFHYYGFYSNVCRGRRKKDDQDYLIPCVLEPDDSWAQAIIKEHEENECENLEFIASVYGEEWLAAPIDEFAFKYTVIDV